MSQARCSTSEDEEQLDFEQAMRDFVSMFPTVSPSAIEAVLRRNGGRVDETIDDLLAVQSDAVEQNKRTLELESPPPYTPRGCDLPCYSASTKKKFEPLILRPLPDDFLRIDTTEPDAGCSQKEKVLLDERDVCLDFADPRLPPMHRQQQHFAQLGVFRMATPMSGYRHYGHNYPRRTHKGLEASDTCSSGFSARRRKRYEETRKQAVVLKDLMAENKFQRQLANDPELERYLEDERVAILLQNQEFMRELRRDRGFMKSLEQDNERGTRRSRGRAASAPDDCPPIPDGPLVGSSSAAVTEGLQLHNEPSFASEHDRCGGAGASVDGAVSGAYDYGADSLPDAAGTAFPYTKTLPAAGEDQTDFADRLKSMSKVTRQRFALAARKFSRRTRPAGPAQYAADADWSHPSRALIDVDDDREDEGQTSTRPNVTAAYDQPHVDDEYNISNRRNLKEGRLFSQ